MSTPVETAMVLAAGHGTRMRPLTSDRPKALVEAGGKALVDHAIDRLRAAGIRRIVVNVHAFADRLRAHLEARGDADIVISDETDALLDTGGAIKRALPLLGAGPVIVHNCDSMWVEGMGATLPRLMAAWDSGPHGCAAGRRRDGGHRGRCGTRRLHDGPGGTPCMA